MSWFYHITTTLCYTLIVVLPFNLLYSQPYVNLYVLEMGQMIYNPFILNDD